MIRQTGSQIVKTNAPVKSGNPAHGLPRGRELVQISGCLLLLPIAYPTLVTSA
ncbi:hypothetical protein C900_03815 [Fulvivirga imtechensis AK7]|uniref:Uncharacterized protein n=1 Tax=Fulvivirga imtechensis AK7 TaxID=1237149 RepID=L8JMS0_9BACT|nr:hypothetical protein C900_03815 [Fulvivirga imtechensis AK7]